MSAAKVAIVTAGGSGMGADAARRLAAMHFASAILSSSGKGAALAQELGGLGVTGSNQSNNDLQRLVEPTHDSAGAPIDVLVNEHGPWPAGHGAERAGPTRSSAQRGLECLSDETCAARPG